MAYPDILHHGAKDGVTDSCHQLLMDSEHSLLIDCGLFQGAETSAEGKSAADRLAIKFPLDAIKALVATHVHIDHVGRNPYLLAAGFKGPTLCSEPSAMMRHLAATARPAIVIAGNGMCSSGRIVNYLKAMLHDPRHDVLFIGYQAQGTPGRAIQMYGERGGYVDLNDERYKIGAKINIIGGYSAHADQQGLPGFVTRMRHWPSQVRIVHGETGAKHEYGERIKALYKEKYRPLELIIPSGANDS